MRAINVQELSQIHPQTTHNNYTRMDSPPYVKCIFIFISCLFTFWHLCCVGSNQTTNQPAIAAIPTNRTRHTTAGNSISISISWFFWFDVIHIIHIAASDFIALFTITIAVQTTKLSFHFSVAVIPHNWSITHSYRLRLRHGTNISSKLKLSMSLSVVACLLTTFHLILYIQMCVCVCGCECVLLFLLPST